MTVTHQAEQSPDYRYVITVDRNDDPGTRVLTQGHRKFSDAQHGYALRIQDARKEFHIPGELLKTDRRSNRRAGFLDSVVVGPVTIILRRRNSSDSNTNITAGPPDSTAAGLVEKIIIGTVTAIFWAAIFIYSGVNYGYRSAVEFLLWILGFFAVIAAACVVFAIAARGVSLLRGRLVLTAHGRRVEYVVRRGLLFVYVVLVTPVILLITIAFAITALGQFIDIWIVTPLQFISVIVDGIKTLAHWIGI